MVLTSLDLIEHELKNGDSSGAQHHQSHITLLGSTTEPQKGSGKAAFRIVVPRIPSYFTGTGDLCAALLLAWSTKMPNQLGNAAEKAVASLQGVLRRTAIAQAEAEASGKTGIGCRELRLVQSQDELLRPEVEETARVTWLE